MKVCNSLKTSPKLYVKFDIIDIFVNFTPLWLKLYILCKRYAFQKLYVYGNCNFNEILRISPK